MNIRSKLNKIKRPEIITALLFFTVYLIVGISVHRDYGISWDEEAGRHLGKMTFDYVTLEIDKPLMLQNRFHGSFYLTLLYAAERTVPNWTTEQKYYLRHLLIFLTFFASAIVFYFLSRKIFGPGWLPLLAVVMLVISPRIFSHSFYNAKDLIFMAFTIFSMYTLMYFLKKKSILSLIMHAMLTGMLIGVRITGVFMPVYSLFFILLTLIVENANLKKYILPVLYALFTLCFVYAFWPLLWNDPFGKFSNSMEVMKTYPWGGYNLFMGQYLSGKDLPWYYIPVWMGITIPILYSALFLTGLYAWARKIFSVMKLKAIFSNTTDILIWAWCFGPWVAILVFNSVIYDAWRHVLFIYPAFVLLAVRGFKILHDKFKTVELKPVKYLMPSLLVVSLIFTIVAMVDLHPHQYLYFNRLAGPSLGEIKDKYDLDTWGLSYREGLEYIARTDKSTRIAVLTDHHPGFVNTVLLPMYDRKRFYVSMETKKADYFITNYRYHKEDYNRTDECWSLMKDGAKIMSVFKMKR